MEENLEIKKKKRERHMEHENDYKSQMISKNKFYINCNENVMYTFCVI